MAGTIVASTLSDGTNSTSTTNCIQGSAKAWVRFNPSTGATVINGSYNTSSVTYVSTGYYQMNFTNALADGNYAAVVTSSDVPTLGTFGVVDNSTAPTSSSIRVYMSNSTASANRNYNSIVIFR